MSHTATESDSFPTAISVPDINDATYPATVAAALTDLASRTKRHELFCTGVNISETSLLVSSVSKPGDQAKQTVSYSIPIPDPAKYGNSEPIGLAAKALLNRIQWISSYTHGIGQIGHGNPGADVSSNPTTLAVSLLATAAPGGFDVSVDTGGDCEVEVTQSSLVAPFCVFPVLGLPARGSIKSVYAELTPPAGHGAMPVSKPRVRLFRQIGVSVLNIVDATDSLTTTGPYETRHTIVANCNHELSSGGQYFIVFSGESSTNSIAGLILHHLQITVGP